MVKSWGEMMCRLTGSESRGHLTRGHMLLSLVLKLMPVRLRLRRLLRLAKRQWLQIVDTAFTALTIALCQCLWFGKRGSTTLEFIVATCPDQAHVRNTLFLTLPVCLLLYSPNRPHIAFCLGQRSCFCHSVYRHSHRKKNKGCRVAQFRQSADCNLLWNRTQGTQ